MKSRQVKWGGHVTYTDEMRNAYRVLVREAEGKRSVRWPEHKLSYIIKIYPNEVLHLFSGLLLL